MVASGARFLFGVVLKPVSEQFGWDRAALAGAVMLAMVCLSVMQPLVGVVIDRVGPKRVVVAGCVLLGLALFPLSLARDLWQVYLFWGVLASVGLAATSPVNATAFVSRWFVHKKALALSVATSGSAFGQLLIVPAATWVLTLTDWASTYRILAVALLAGMVPLGLLFLRDGPAGTVAASREPDAVGVGVREALRCRAFWLLAFGFVVCGWTMAFPNVHFLAYADDMGMSVLHAANAVSVTAIFSIAGSLLLGIAADRHRRTSVLALVYALRGLAFVLLAALPVGNLVFVYAVVLGISWTATTPLTAAVAADRYGPRHLGAIFGAMFTFMNLGFGVGSLADGVLYDATGSYALSLWVNVALGAAATVGILLVERAPQVRSTSPRSTASMPAAAD
jgi:MFS family permease